MPTDAISLDEASWRLEQSKISAAMLVELLLRSEPLLLGQRPGNTLRDPIDLSRVTRFRGEPGNIVVVGDLTWTGVKLSWRELCAGFKKRGCKVSWWFAWDITPEMLDRASRPDPTRRLLDDLRPPRRFIHSVPVTPQPPRRASDGWFANATYTSYVPASGKAPLARRGPSSGKRETAAAGMRQALADNTLTVKMLREMPEKELAHRYGVSRDTARKARYDALESFAENSKTPFDK